METSIIRTSELGLEMVRYISMQKISTFLCGTVYGVKIMKPRLKKKQDAILAALPRRSLAPWRLLFRFDRDPSTPAVSLTRRPLAPRIYIYTQGATESRNTLCIRLTTPRFTVNHSTNNMRRSASIHVGFVTKQCKKKAKRKKKQREKKRSFDSYVVVCVILLPRRPRASQVRDQAPRSMFFSLLSAPSLCVLPADTRGGKHIFPMSTTCFKV